VTLTNFRVQSIGVRSQINVVTVLSLAKAVERTLFLYGYSFLLIGLLTASCHSDDDDRMTRAFVISNLSYNTTPIPITDDPYFTFSGSLQFAGAVNGVASLKLTSSLGATATVPVTGVSQSSGLLQGDFTFDMIKTPGTYTFEVWLIDQAGRPSNKLSGSITMIPDPNKHPTAVVLVSVEFDAQSQSPLISWTKNMDADFYAYIITRHIVDPNHPWNGEEQEVTRIYDPAVTSTYDPNNPGTIGFNFVYNVNVSNNKFQVPSNYVSLNYPPAIELADQVGINIASRPLASHQRNELYFLDNGSYWGHTGSLIAFSTVSNTRVRSFDFHLPLSVAGFSLSMDESRISCLLDDSLFIINAADFSLVKSMHLNFMASTVAFGRAGRLYVRCIAPAAEKGFKMLNEETGAVVGSLNKSFNMIVTDAGNTVYGIGPTLDANGFPTGTNTLWRIDVTTDVPVIMEAREMGVISYGLGLSADEQKLFVAYNSSQVNGNETLEELNPVTLAYVASSAQPWLREFIVTDDYVFTISEETTATYAFIKQIGIADHVLMNTWQLRATAPEQIHFSKPGNCLYIFGARSWVIDLHD
jgi:hypothetical protein